ncbi:MAG: hypothetical protein QME79_12335 [Bacillota bacterium]|nr:hypothetical protein [Bacillota bacterium]
MLFTLRNEGANRFSPRDRNSAWNQFGGNYAPLLWPNREVMLKTKVEKSDEYTKLAEPSFSRSSVAYLPDGTQVAAGVPRFLDSIFSYGLLVEEGTTNLLTANQASVETDTSGFAAYHSTISRVTSEHWHGSASLMVVTAGTDEFDGVRIDGTPCTPSTVYTVSVWVKAQAGKTLRLRMYTPNVAEYGRATFVTTGSWQRVSMIKITAASATTVGFAIEANTAQAVTFYVDGLQIEQKSYATTWQLPGTARSPETLTIPTAGVLNLAGPYTLEVLAQVTNRDVLPFIFFKDWSNYVCFGYRGDSKMYHMKMVKGGTTVFSVNSSVLGLTGFVRSVLVYTGSKYIGYANGVKVCEVSSSEQVGSDWPFTPGNINNFCINGLLDDLRISSIARSDAEILAAHQSGLPLPVDRYTTLKLSFDGYLYQPWVTLFHGYLGDNIQTDGPTVTCLCRDLAKRLQNCYIETSREYGSEAGTPAETVIQQIIDDNLGAGQVTLYCPVSPGFMIKPYTVEYVTVWDAIQQVAAQIGWFLGYRWDSATGQFRLTLMEPPRTKSAATVDFVLDYTDDFYAEELDITDADVRNAIKVTYRNSATGQRASVTVEDAASIAEYGCRAMQIEEADTSLIDTQAEAQALANAALADLKDLTATTRIEMPFLPTMDVFSGIVIHDPRVSSTDDFFGVESVLHTLEFPDGDDEKILTRTEVVAAGRVVGAHAKWIRMEARPGARVPLTPYHLPTQSTPDVPAGLALASAIRGLVVTLTKPTDLYWDGFEIHVSTTSGFAPGPSTLKAKGRATRFEIVDLTPGTTYYVKARAYDSAGNYSAYTSEASQVAGQVVAQDIDPAAGVARTDAVAVTVSAGFTTRQAMPTARSYAAAATPGDGYLYVIGGYNGTSVLGTNERYDPAGNAWTAKASMPTARQNLSLAAPGNGKLYAVGGDNGSPSSYLDTNEEYDPVGNSWTAKAAMPTARRALAAAAPGNGKLYAIGGNTGLDQVVTNQEYNPATNTWATKATMPTKRTALAAVALGNGKVYAIGGYQTDTALAVNEEYSPATNTWTSKASMPTARYSAAAAAPVSNRLFVVGGNAGSTVYAKNEEYDPEINTWTARTDMPTARSGLVAVGPGNGKFYAVGGGSYLSTNEAYDPGSCQSPVSGIVRWPDMSVEGVVRGNLYTAPISGTAVFIGAES